MRVCQSGGVDVAVVVLAGGGSRRWSGRDKTTVVLRGTSVLERAVTGLVDGVAAGEGAPPVDVVVVGPAEHPAAAALPSARWTRQSLPPVR